MKDPRDSSAPLSPAPSPLELIFSQRGFLMGLSMLLIMMYHQHFLDGMPVLETLALPFTLFGLVGVDVFLFLSGMGIAASLQRNSLAGFYRNRVLRLLPAWVLVVVALYLLDNLRGPHQVATVLAVVERLWFLNALAVLYLLSPWLLRLVRVIGLRGIVLLAVAIGVFQILYSLRCLPGVRLPSLAFVLGLPRVPVYLLGLFVLTDKFPASSLRGCSWKLPALLFLFAAPVVVVASYVKGYRVDDCCNWFSMNVAPCVLYAFAILPLCLVLARLGRRLEGKWVYGLVLPFGTLSLELYLWHEWIFRKAQGQMSLHGLQDWGWLLLAAAMLLSLILAWVTHGFCAKMTTPLKKA